MTIQTWIIGGNLIILLVYVLFVMPAIRRYLSYQVLGVSSSRRLLPLYFALGSAVFFSFATYGLLPTIRLNIGDTLAIISLLNVFALLVCLGWIYLERDSIWGFVPDELQAAWDKPIDRDAILNEMMDSGKLKITNEEDNPVDFDTLKENLPDG